ALLGATGVQAVRSQSGPGLSVVYVEFDWNANVYLARQTVQERLATVTGSLPEGVKPQMAPVRSIMGQIMIVGAYRRPGPNGGELAPVGQTGLMAELTHDPAEGRATLRLWDPVVRGDAARWQPAGAGPGPVTLTWTVPRPRVGPAPGGDRPAPRPREVL